MFEQYRQTVHSTMYNDSIIPTCGKTILPISRHGRKFNVLFIVVEDELAPIIGLNTIEKMDLIRRVDKVKEIHQTIQHLDTKREVKGLLKDIQSSLKYEGTPYPIITEKYDPCFQPLSSEGTFGTLPRTHDINVCMYKIVLQWVKNNNNKYFIHNNN